MRRGKEDCFYSISCCELIASRLISPSHSLSLSSLPFLSSLSSLSPASPLLLSLALLSRLLFLYFSLARSLSLCLRLSLSVFVSECLSCSLSLYIILPPTVSSLLSERCMSDTVCVMFHGVSVPVLL